jgi:hypothetical protein
MKKAIFLVLLVVALGLMPVASQATFYSTRASWEAAVSSFFDVDLAGQVSQGATLATGIPLTLPLLDTVTFNVALIGAQVPSGGWATWSGGNTPRVLATYNTRATSVIANFPTGQSAFGLEMEPNNFAIESMTLTLGSGPALQQNVDGNGGAAFFGWVGAPETFITLSNDASDTFAFGRMVEGTVSVPVPPSVLLLGSGLLGLVGFRRKFLK